jgi:hypothetical protein
LLEIAVRFFIMEEGRKEEGRNEGRKGLIIFIININI